LEIADAGGGIGKVRLYLNGVAVLTDGGRGMKRQTGERRSYRLKLTDGENRLQAIVFNADNTMESNPARHTVMADLGKERHDLYALVIGINEYANPTLSLKYAVPDALLFETSLQTATAGLFDRVEITRLTSATETTRSRIVTALESMQKLGPADTFVFYVASHGLVDDGAYYMITSNVGSLSTRKLKETALAQRELQDLLINVPAGKKMILFDTCNSGAMGTSLQVATLTRGLSETTAMKLLSRAVGSTVISASSSTQEALEGYKGHGLFTYVLSQGITGKADANRDGFVKTRELADYVEDEVTEIAEREFQRAQYPTTTPTGDAFPIARTERQ
ncbi:MAG: caspase family protein, partial [Candidatus Marinimicrobia bacterium]|nr:caspase family protein [Candidatus Neomarinimicrobiota bacterium]